MGNGVTGESEEKERAEKRGNPPFMRHGKFLSDTEIAGFGGGGLRPIAPAIMSQSAMAATMGMAVLQFSQCLGNCFSPIYGAFIDAGFTYWEGCMYTILPLSVIMLVLSFFIRPDKDSKSPSE